MHWTSSRTGIILKLSLQFLELKKYAEQNTRRIVMESPKVIHSTFVVERSFPQPPETVFAAFADPAKARRWYASGDGHEVEEFTSDFRVGGRQLLRYRLGPQTPVAGMIIN